MTAAVPVDITKQAKLTQERPHHICQNRGLYLQLSRECGYHKKCRDPRCSIECLKAYMEQENMLLQYFWQDRLPAGMRTFRGNLTPYPGASVADHREIRRAFLRKLAAWARENGKVFRLRAYSDCTSHEDCHYDFVAYVSDDVGVDRVKQLVADAWRAAGGRRSSTKTLHEEDQGAWSCYTTKTRNRDERRYRYVPWRPEQEDDPPALDFTWGTTGFWGSGTTRAALWKDLIRVLYPKRMVASVVPAEASPRPITMGVTRLPLLRTCLPSKGLWR